MASTAPMLIGSSGPALDSQGNVLPDAVKAKVESVERYDPTSPLPRLAAVADLKRPVPTAGGYSIEHVKPREFDIPPECYLYDEDRPWVLGKLTAESLDLPEPAEPVPLSQKTIDYLDTLEEAARIGMRKQRGEANALEETEAKELTPKPKNHPAPKGVSKYRNGPQTPAKGKARPASATQVKSVTSPSPRTGKNPIVKTNTPKAPAVGVSSQAKVVPSAASVSNKVRNAKIDHKTLEKSWKY